MTERRVSLIAVVEAEVYDGMSDAQVAKEIDREVVYRAGLLRGRLLRLPGLHLRP